MAARKKATEEATKTASTTTTTTTTTTSKKYKYPIGSIVYINKDVLADLNGFSLFPQYKKYTYTVEAYDEKLGVYSLRRANLLLSLKEGSIINPDEKAHDILNRKQF